MKEIDVLELHNHIDYHYLSWAKFILKLALANDRRLRGNYNASTNCIEYK